ncbi:hypothetical protein AV530_019341 [Patagioenas fasciata monilis]|uniref:Uncharacterized protein n=1 Tax=Patagioenas fasciata monilis TaxID=372326 RepID=A0A1V4JCS9_PATFA|nr:hypothetical protein AV530_019341 [Patagioenas fasciata monilis]
MLGPRQVRKLGRGILKAVSYSDDQQRVKESEKYYTSSGKRVMLAGKGYPSLWTTPQFEQQSDWLKQADALRNGIMTSGTYAITSELGANPGYQ